MLWIYEHRKHTQAHTSLSVWTPNAIYPQIILILRHVGHLDLGWGGGWRGKKQSLFISLFNPKPPVAFGSLSESLFHPGDSADKHVVPTKDSESSQRPVLPPQFHPFFPPLYKRSISKPSDFATLSVKNEKAVSSLAVCTATSSKIYLNHRTWLLSLPNFQIRQSILLLQLFKIIYTAFFLKGFLFVTFLSWIVQKWRQKWFKRKYTLKVLLKMHFMANTTNVNEKKALSSRSSLS